MWGRRKFGPRLDDLVTQDEMDHFLQSQVNYALRDWVPLIPPPQPIPTSEPARSSTGTTIVYLQQQSVVTSSTSKPIKKDAATQIESKDFVEMESTAPIYPSGAKPDNNNSKNEREVQTESKYSKLTVNLSLTQSASTAYIPPRAPAYVPPRNRSRVNP